MTERWHCAAVRRSNDAGSGVRTILRLGDVAATDQQCGAVAAHCGRDATRAAAAAGASKAPRREDRLGVHGSRETAAQQAATGQQWPAAGLRPAAAASGSLWPATAKPRQATARRTAQGNRAW